MKRYGGKAIWTGSIFNHLKQSNLKKFPYLHKFPLELKKINFRFFSSFVFPALSFQYRQGGKTDSVIQTSCFLLTRCGHLHSIQRLNLLIHGSKNYRYAKFSISMKDGLYLIGELYHSTS